MLLDGLPRKKWVLLIKRQVYVDSLQIWGGDRSSRSAVKEWYCENPQGGIRRNVFKATHANFEMNPAFWV